jgi:hypothetical protein
MQIWKVLEGKINNLPKYHLYRFIAPDNGDNEWTGETEREYGVNTTGTEYNFEEISLSGNSYYYYKSDYRFNTGLTITDLLPSTNDSLGIYAIEFTATKEELTFKWPITLKWQNGLYPQIEAGKTYQITIINNLAMWTAFSQPVD